MTAIPKPSRRGRARSGPPAKLQTYRDWQKEADRLWSLIIRARDKVCRRCRAKATTDAMHCVSRSYHRVRHELTNGLGGCRGCHRLMGVDQHEHVRIVTREIGEERWEHLNVMKSAGPKADPRTAAQYLRFVAEQQGLITKEGANGKREDTK